MSRRFHSLGRPVAADALDTEDPHPGRFAIGVWLIGFFLVPLIAIADVSFSLGLPGGLAYCAVIAGNLVCWGAIWLSEGGPWYCKIAFAIMTTLGILVEIPIIGFLLIEMTGLDGIQ